MYLSSLQRQSRQRLDQLRQLPLTPQEYCQRWVFKLTGIAPQERGYRSACIRELAKVTGLKERSIDNNWGQNFQDHPQWVKVCLRHADLVNQMREVIARDDFPCA